MKITVWTMLFVFLSSTPALARLGETLHKCNLRYGRPLSQPVERDDDTILARYKWQVFNVTVIFSEDRKAIKISYTLQNGEPMSMRRMEDLLNENPSIKKEGFTIQSINTWFIDEVDPLKNRVIFSHKDNLADSFYYISKKELVISLAR